MTRAEAAAIPEEPVAVLDEANLVKLLMNCRGLDNGFHVAVDAGTSECCTT
jgi:hypothetical protein